MICVADTMSAISDDKALSLFKAVAISENDCSSILITKLRLTRKQYYSRIKKLMYVGLVKRIGSKFSLTSFGKVIYSKVINIETAIEYFWKLKAIDSITMSANSDLPPQEYQKIIDTLIDDHEIKDVLISYYVKLVSPTIANPAPTSILRKKRIRNGTNKNNYSQSIF
jgi:predicted transcriptional regulator